MKAKAIVFGLVAWFNVSLVFGGLSFLSVRALSSDVLKAFIPMLLLFHLAVGLFTAFLGGYVAGRVAKSAELTHAAVIGAVIAVLGFGFTFVIHSRHPRPVGYRLAIASFEFGSAVFGGLLANWRNEKSNHSVQSTRALAGTRD